MNFGHQVGMVFSERRCVESGSRDTGKPDALATVELLQEPDFMYAEWAINVVEHFDREFVGHQDSLLLSS